MAVKVVTYQDPTDIKQLSAYSDHLHICATRNMFKGVLQRYQLKSFDIKAPIIPANIFISQMLGEWESSETKLEQFLHITKKLKQFKSTNLVRAFRRNQLEVLETIRTLEVLSIRPDDLPKEHLTEKENLLIKIWDELRTSHSSFKNLEKILSNFKYFWRLKKRDIIYNAFQEMYSDREKESIKNNIEKKYVAESEETIVLHGFYFLTPVQQKIFQLLKEAGMNIVFMNLYVPEYPNTFGFIKKFINEQNGWVDIDDEKGESSCLFLKHTAQKLLLDFEGKVDDNNLQDQEVKLCKFDTFYELVNRIERDGDKDVTYLAPNANSLNERLQDYFPEKYQHRRHFLSYPVGQFFYQLHRMWDGQRGTYVIDENGLFECFSSGWIYDEKEKKNARDYTGILDELLPYFKGCVTKDDWLNRLNQLQQIYEEVLRPFEKEGDNRYQKMMRSPFSRFSYFSVHKSDMLQVGSFIKQVFHMAEYLFGSGKESITLHEYFDKLKELMQKNEPYLQLERKEEIELLNKIKTKLRVKPSEEEFLVDDMCYAIQLYLSGKLEREEDEMIKPFIEIDGEAFKENRYTHVTGLDEDSLPYSEFKLPWPLSQETFDVLCHKSLALSLEKVRNNHVKDITRYLLFNLFQFTNQTTLSWIVHFEDKENLDMAIYLTLLDLKLEEDNDKNEMEYTPNEGLSNEAKYLVAEGAVPYNDIPDDFFAEFLYCPRRFFYAFIASEYSTYTDEFHYQFLFGNLVKVMKATTQFSDKQIKEELDKIFPYWTKYRKDVYFKNNSTYNDFMKKHYAGYSEYAGESFSDMRKLFLFPVSLNPKTFNDKESKNVAEQLENFYKDSSMYRQDMIQQIEQEVLNANVPFKANPNDNCRYCPYIHICSSANLPVDDEARKMVKQ